jgi:SnoaL-like domain
MTDADIQLLRDRLEIDDLLTRYTRAVDSGDWERLDDVFTSDARIDYTETGGIAGTYPEIKAWLPTVLKLFPRRQHIVMQREVTIDGDTASVVAYFLNPMVFAAPGGAEQLWEFGGLYHHSLVRTKTGWRSRELREELIWKRGMDGAP